MAATVRGRSRIVPDATARRGTSGFDRMSTIRAIVSAREAGLFHDSQVSDIVNACAPVGRVSRGLSIARAGHCQVGVSDAGALNYGPGR